MGLGATHSTRRRRWGQANVHFAQPNPFKVITTMQMNLRSFCRKRLCVRITPSSPHITAANHRAPNTDPGASGNSVLTRNEKVEPPPRGGPLPSLRYRNTVTEKHARHNKINYICHPTEGPSRGQIGNRRAAKRNYPALNTPFWQHAVLYIGEPKSGVGGRGFVRFPCEIPFGLDSGAYYATDGFPKAKRNWEHAVLCSAPCDNEL
ncbi:uncharacterized protein PADG_07258 [Paracoccidioides brasiliensis Pb18]|uniref:Uncharacterized protein n=1 Tax=Paracoccidioides brasiliensis (strain Pb18) TaxID=502780 RepID=C1GJ22_PARBD|nr:uncharacterized protein PADG_07258 [Paracoccidioides brasiliensis Pb18]EEH42438.2 hypothetical protein PADG_07258 [Paracoccidioides brasiliensis Pb18]